MIARKTGSAVRKNCAAAPRIYRPFQEERPVGRGNPEVRGPPQTRDPPGVRQRSEAEVGEIGRGKGRPAASPKDRQRGAELIRARRAERDRRNAGIAAYRRAGARSDHGWHVASESHQDATGGLRKQRHLPRSVQTRLSGRCVRRCGQLGEWRALRIVHP